MLLQKEQVLQIVREQLFYNIKDQLAFQLVQELTPLIASELTCIHKKKHRTSKYTEAVEHAQAMIDEKFIFLMRSLEATIA